MNHKEDRLGWSCCVLNDGWVVMGIAVSLNGFITDASAWLENQKMTGSAMNECKNQPSTINKFTTLLSLVYSLTLHVYYCNNTVEEFVYQPTGFS